MIKMINLFKKIFSNKYTEYTLHSSKEIKKEIKKEIPDPNVEYHVDPMDYITVGTGEYYTIIRQTWVAYHKKTGLPKYKIIDIE